MIYTSEQKDAIRIFIIFYFLHLFFND